MRLALDKRTIEYVYLGILLVIASALILSNLGNQYLWQDEAATDARLVMVVKRVNGE